MPELLYSDLTGSIIGAAMEVHRVLGHGFLEAVYEAALAHELDLRGSPTSARNASPSPTRARRWAITWRTLWWMGKWSWN